MANTAMNVHTPQTNTIYPTPQDKLLSSKLLKFIVFNQTASYWFFRPMMAAFAYRTQLLLKPTQLDPSKHYIIAANHQSMIDPFVVCYALSPQLFARLVPFRYFAHNALFDKVLRSILLCLGAFPASRNSRYSYGLEAARLFLQHHQSIVIFPEGRRVVGLTRPRSGIEVLAKDPNVEIIPVHIQWYKNKWHYRSYRIVIGSPLTEKNLSARQILNRIYKLPFSTNDWADLK